MKNTNIIYSILAATVILISCSENKSNETLPSSEVGSSHIRVEKTQFDQSEFQLGTVSSQSFISGLEVTGKIHLPEKSKAAVSSLLDGTVGTVNLIEGEYVSKGTTLFTITNPELINMQEDYIVIEGQLAYLREEYDRQTKLSAENITTKKELLKAQSELNTAEARYQALKQKLKLYGISTNNLTAYNLTSKIAVTAPISGIVSDIQVLQGGYLASNSTAMTLSNTNHIHLELSILEKDAHSLKKDQAILFNLQDDTSKKYKAKIYLINKVVGENRMVSIHAHIDDDSAKTLIPGMFAQATIIIDEEKTPALPKDALIKIDKDYYALKLVQQNESSYQFEQVKVNTNTEMNGYISTPSLATDHSQYLTKGAYFLIQ